MSVLCPQAEITSAQKSFGQIRAILSTKLVAEKRELERRLARLLGRIEPKEMARRPYPKVHPKYRNPEQPSEVWARQATALGRSPVDVGKEGR
jgi:hypothetical protein